MFPAFIVAGGIPGQIDLDMQALLLINALLTVVLFLIVPLLFAWFGHTRFVTTFALALPGWRAIAGAVLIGVSLWMFVYEVELFTLSAQRVELLKELFEKIKVGLDEVPLVWKLISTSSAGKTT